MGGWKAGTSSVNITPSEPHWMAGFAARTEPSRGTISDLYATALALEDSVGRKLLLLSIDLIAIPRWFADPIIEMVRQHHDIPRENVIVAASHTHFAPEIRPDKVLFFKIPADYAAKIGPLGEKIQHQITDAALRAMENLSPVRLIARRSSAGFAHNRRPHGDINDHDVPVLDVQNSDGTRKAIVFGYACHNTTLDPQDRRFCADWAGFARTYLEQANPGAKALFVTGCGADQNPDPRGTLELSQKYGRELGEAVQKCLSEPGVEVEAKLAVAMEDIELAMQPVTREWIEASLASDDPPRRVKAIFLKELLDSGVKLESSYPAPLQVVKLGQQVLMIVMSGETVVDWAHKFKKQFAGPMVWVAGYCNDMFGYIPTLRVQREGGYEGGRANLWSAMPSPWTEEIEERITRGVQRLVARVGFCHPERSEGSRGGSG